MQHRMLKSGFAHYVIQTIDHQDGLVAVQNVALIRTVHVMTEGVSTLGDIVDA